MYRRIVWSGLAAALFLALSLAPTGAKPKRNVDVCLTGTQQSPVNIAGVIRAQLDPLQIRYRAGIYRVYNDGHTIKVLAPPGNELQVGSAVYRLREFHFHIHAEHTVGTAPPAVMELHFVNDHVSDGTAAALGVFLGRSTPNAAFTAIMNVAPRQVGEGYAVSVQLDPNLLLPADRRYWTYMGSLTTPPCSETVRWLVLQTPAIVNDADITRFMTYYTDNWRPLQNINRRFILSGP